MKLERTCRNPDCGKTTRLTRETKPDSLAMTRCGRCKTPYGPIAFGLDRDLDLPTGLTPAEKDAEWKATLDSFRRDMRR